MSRRLQSRQRVETSAGAAVAADRWIGSVRRQQACSALSADPAIQHLLPDLAAIPRIARRLPNGVGGLLMAFTDHPDLAPWLRTEQDFFRLCRTVGAVLYGAELARFVDGEDIAMLIDDLGPDAWRFGIEHALEPATLAPGHGVNGDFSLGRSDLTDTLLAAGLRAVYRHLQDVLPDHLDDICAALDLNAHEIGAHEIGGHEIDGGGDPARDNEAIRRVLAHVRTP
jgi:hypothetical protein